MKPLDFSTHLEAALHQLNAGEDLEHILTAYPGQAAELRPLLDAARSARLPAAAQPDRLAQNRNRARFLAAAQSQTRRRAPFSLARLALNAVAALLLVIVSLGIGGLASVQALPGDALYPVKQALERAQLALSSGALNRLMLEEQFDSRHAAEIEQLIARGSSGQNVGFAGILTLGAVDGFWVAGIPLQLSSELEVSAFNLMGAYVELEGTLLSDGHVQVRQLQLRLFNIHGRLQQIAAAAWLVDGVWIEIAPQTQILRQPQTGQLVNLTAIQLSEGQFLALAVALDKAPSPTRASATLFPQSGEAPGPVLSTPLSATEEYDETAEPRQTGAPDDTETVDDDKSDDAEIETETESEAETEIKTVEPAETEESDKTGTPGG